MANFIQRTEILEPNTDDGKFEKKKHCTLGNGGKLNVEVDLK
jgi:hypothetical protein